MTELGITLFPYQNFSEANFDNQNVFMESESTLSRKSDVSLQYQLAGVLALSICHFLL